MPAGPQATVAVQYRFMDGYHVFTSHEVYGLYVASKEPERAFADVGPAIEELLRLNEGINCRVEPAVSLKEFLNGMRGKEPEPRGAHPLSSRRYVLRPAA